MNVLVAAYSVIVGLFMIGFWGVLVARKQAELDQRPWDMRLHIAAELATAILLVLTGVGAVLESTGLAGLAPIALGMLLYTTVNSPGFYVGKRNWPMVAMFAVLTGLTLIAIVGLLFLTP
ncbi:MAG TPA: hypothetical protein VEY12_12450 [Thermoplasmata archaeon]|nr:hypothetical protein [Thermoplasmata archaeon]